MIQPQYWLYWAAACRVLAGTRHQAEPGDPPSSSPAPNSTGGGCPDHGKAVPNTQGWEKGARAEANQVVLGL